MSDFDGSKPVKTVRDDEFKIIVVDGASGDTATKKMSIVVAGDAYSAGVNDQGVVIMGKDGSGNAIIIPVPLPITDNGGSLTVDGTVAITGDVNVTATNLDIRDLAFATDKVDVSGSAVSITGDVNVTATNLDIRDLTHASDSVKIGDGTDFLAVNADGSINVNASPAANTKVCQYNTTATVGVGSSSLHFYVVPNAKKFTGLSLLVGARGAVKVAFGLSTNGTALTSTLGVYFQDPKENRSHDIGGIDMIGDGTAAICVEITNLDGQSSDVYSTIQGSFV